MSYITIEGRFRPTAYFFETQNGPYFRLIHSSISLYNLDISLPKLCNLTKKSKPGYSHRVRNIILTIFPFHGSYVQLLSPIFNIMHPNFKYSQVYYIDAWISHFFLMVKCFWMFRFLFYVLIHYWQNVLIKAKASVIIVFKKG